jgi:hypothetical protein
MRFTYKSCDYHFKDRVNPNTKGYFNIIVGRNHGHLKTYRIIDRLKKIIFSQSAILASPLNFTLCNVTSLLSAISFGYSQEPVNVLRFDSTIAFTFALRADSDLLYNSVPANIKKVNREITFWGYQHSNEFVTIAIDIADIIEEGLSIKDFEYLYLVCGSVAKNFANFKEAAQHSMPKNKGIIAKNYSYIYNLDLATLFYTIPYVEWVYNKEIWESAPEVIPASQIHPYSALYYALFLSTKQMTAKYIVNIAGCGHLLNELYKYYLRSQQMLISNQVGETDYSEEQDQLISHIYPAAIYCIFHMMNTPGYREWKPRARLSNLYEWISQISQKLQEDLFIHNDIQFLCQMPSLAKDAIINRLSTFRKAAVILGEQSKHVWFTGSR